MAEGTSVPFNVVAEDLVYPVPPGAAAIPTSSISVSIRRR